VAFPWNEQSRFLGLDVGDRRIGVAVSDPTGSLARPVEIYTRRGSRVDVDHIVDLAGEYEAVKVVVGLPKNMNGTEGPQAEKTRDFASALSERGLQVDLWDERLSTVEASRRLIEQRRRGQRLRERLDSEAAAVILQTYLDHVRIKEGR
jgi:putative Holliday junction resolvase